MKVLLVVGDDDARDLLAQVLTADGLAVVAEGRNEAALQRLLADPFDCIIAEVHPTQQGAFNLLYAVREHADGRVADTPFVIVAGRNRPVDRLRAWEAGCDAFMSKPVHIGEIIAAVRESVDRSVNERARHRKETFDAERRKVAEERAAQHR